MNFISVIHGAYMIIVAYSWAISLEWMRNYSYLFMDSFKVIKYCRVNLLMNIILSDIFIVCVDDFIVHVSHTIFLDVIFVINSTMILF